MLVRTLSRDDHARIHQAIAAARQATSAEFELVVVPASDRHALVPILWGALAALLATGALALLRPDLAIGLGVVVDAGLLVALTLLFDWWPMRMLIVPRAAKHRAASRLAHREFAVRMVARTPARNGVMLFVSLAERYAEILADRAIHERVPEGTWDRIVADFTAAMRRKDHAEAFTAAIAACGAVLATAFPREPATG